MKTGFPLIAALVALIGKSFGQQPNVSFLKSCKAKGTYELVMCFLYDIHPDMAEKQEASKPRQPQFLDGLLDNFNFTLSL